jgi:hypothetical protein
MAIATIIGAAITAVGGLLQTAIQASAQTTNDEGPAGDSLDGMKAEYGTGVSTEIEIENATGATMTLVSEYDYHGHLFKYPVPPAIGAGQTGCFLHVKTAGAATGSEGAIVYRYQDLDGVYKDVFFGWCTPWSGTPTCYTEVREANHWPSQGSWGFMQDLIERSTGVSTNDNGSAVSVASIGNSTSPRCNFHISYLKATSSRVEAIRNNVRANALEARVAALEARLK